MKTLIDRELFQRICVFFAKLDFEMMTSKDLHLSREEIRDILCALSREQFLYPEDMMEDKKYGTDAVRPHVPYFVPDTEHTGKTKDTGLEYMNNVPNDWPPAPVTSCTSSLTDIHKLQDDEERKKIENFMKLCDEVKSRPQYKEGTLEAELQFWRDYNDKH